MNKPQRCIICKTKCLEQHSFYPALCLKCGDFNYAKRNQTANLQGKVAAVTGARTNIGYAVALRLLRAGAFVIATTRFPHDAATRYAKESDFCEFQHRLHIYRLDLRHIARVENFTQHISCFYPRLDIIINNAAQTIRRPSGFYHHLREFLAVGNRVYADEEFLAVGNRVYTDEEFLAVGNRVYTDEVHRSGLMPSYTEQKNDDVIARYHLP